MTAGIQNAQSYDVMGDWSLMRVVSTCEFEEPLLLRVIFFAWSSQVGQLLIKITRE